MADEVGGESALTQEVPERDGGGVLAGEEAAGAAVEDRHLGQQSQVAAAPGCARGEQRGRAAGARVLQAAAVAADGHAHFGVLRAYVQLAEMPEKGGVGAFVVDDESRVHRYRPPSGARHVAGVGVAAEPVFGLVQGDLVRGRQDVGGGQARDPTSYDGRFPLFHSRRSRHSTRRQAAAFHSYFAAARRPDWRRSAACSVVARRLFRR